MQKTYDLTEAAEVLKCCAEKVRQLILDKELKAVKIGKRWVIAEQWLNEFLDKALREASL
jgi:excisionase family DNA binding protein